MSASTLLTQLLNDVLEQDKEIDPRGFRLQGHKGFLKSRRDLQRPPGVDINIELECYQSFPIRTGLQAGPGRGS